MQRYYEIIFLKAPLCESQTLQKNLDDEYVRFFQPIGLQKRIVKEKWWVVGKVIYNRRNYCKKVITENKEGEEEFIIGSIWKIVKKVLKISKRK